MSIIVLVCSVYAAISIGLLYYLKRQGWDRLRLIWTGLFLISLCAAFAWKQSVDVGMVSRFTPFYKLVQYSEFGYRSFLSDLAGFGLPFLFMGMFLLFAFPGVRLWQSALLGGLCALIFHAYGLLSGARPFVLDEYLYAALGAAAGTGLAALLLGLFQKAPWLPRIGLGVPPIAMRRASLWVCGVIYIGIALLLIIDFGTPYGNLSLFESSISLPQDMRSTVDFSEKAPSRVPVYAANAGNLEQQIKEIATGLGVVDEVQDLGGNSYAVVDENGTMVMMDGSGAWSYQTHALSEEGASLPSLEEAEQLARAFFQEHSIPGIDLGPLTDSMEVMPTWKPGEFDPEEMTQAEYDELVALSQLPTAYRLYFSTLVDGYRLRNGNELLVTVHAGGVITKIQALGSSLKQAGSVSILSPQQALDMVLKGEIQSYTLFSPANSVVFTGYELVYFADTSQGYWLPAWAFQGTASTEEGETISFEAYVPAKK